MLLPIPGTAAKWIFFDKVTVNRCYPALGLINITIVILALAQPVSGRNSSSFDRKQLAFYCRTYLGFFLLAAILLILTNSAMQSYFRTMVVIAAAAYTAVLVFCIFHRWHPAFAATLLLPLLVQNALVNPLDRGLDTVMASNLFKRGRSDSQLRDGKGLIYSQWIEQAGFLSAVGLDTMNSMKIVPDLKRTTLADPEARFTSIYNQSSYLIAEALPEGEKSQFASPSLGIVVWKVNPFDPVLKEMGIRFLAFDREPNAELKNRLRPLENVRSPGLWLYEAP
jgi:hypothetical protein